MTEQQEATMEEQCNNDSPEADQQAEVDNDEQVKALAASLAPQMEQLDTLLSTPQKEFIPEEEKESNVDDDDDMDAEWSQLKNSASLLRQELEFAHDFSHLFRSEEQDSNDGILVPTLQDSKREPAVALEEDYVRVEKSVVPSTPPSSSEGVYTLGHHARHLGFQVEPRGGWYSYPVSLEEDHQECFSREYILPVPTADLKRFYVGIVDSSLSVSNNDESASLLDDSSTLLTSPTETSLAHHSSNEILPVRTIAIRIRPDVLCGAVMDAVYHALETMNAQVTKRQGGHLKATVGFTRIVTPTEERFDETSPARATLEELPPFAVDAQLCMYKGNSENNCERMLLIRTYVTTGEMEIPPTTETEQQYDFVKPTTKLKECSALVQRIESEGSSTLLWTRTAETSTFASYLSPLKLFSSSPPPATSSPAMMAHTGQEMSSTERRDSIIQSTLIHHARPCPSVLEGGLTLPALSKHDLPVAQSSWRFIVECWNELWSRDLAYSTLATCPFGGFPALPTLDVHYCSQMQRHAREGMVLSLIKSASELEQFARESEFSCALLIKGLEPVFEHYQLPPPALPMPVPLTAYPLDYPLPQVACPPWGFKVMEAMNMVSAMTTESNKARGGGAQQEFHEFTTQKETNDYSFEAAKEAVRIVLSAFTHQFDEEQAARLGRKNVQVMDRLAKMQAHKRASIHVLSHGAEQSPDALKMATEFHQHALEAQESVPLDDARDYHEVPLFWCNIMVGGTTGGTCYVTARHLMLVTKAIPIVGGNKCTLFDLTKIELDLYQPSRIVSPIVSEGISIVQNNETVYSFRPYSVGGKRFKELVQIIQQAATEDPDNLKFSDRGGLLYLYADSEPHSTPQVPPEPTNVNETNGEATSESETLAKDSTKPIEDGTKQKISEPKQTEEKVKE